MITDKLKSDAPAKKMAMPGVEHRQHLGLNNCAELSHPRTCQRERPMQRFKLPRQVQRLFFTHGPINNLFYLRRHRIPATQFRVAHGGAFHRWLQVTCVPNAA